MRSLAPLLLAVTACMVGPDFVKPKVAVNADLEREPRSATRRRDCRGHRVVEERSTIQRSISSIDLAYQQNLNLQIAALRILEARAQLGIARPTVAGRRTESDRIGRSAQRPRATPRSRSQLSARTRSASMPRGSSISGASTGAASSAANAELARDRRRLRQCAGLAQRRGRAQLRRDPHVRGARSPQARQNEAIQEEALQIAQSRFRNGATSELDVAQATNLLETHARDDPQAQSRPAAGRRTR